MTSDELQKLVNQQLIAFKNGEASYPAVLLQLLQRKVELETSLDRHLRHYYPK